MENYKKQLKVTNAFIEQLPWDDKIFYSNFLAQTYYFVCHSTRLLALSISKFGVDRDHLYKRFVAHLKEENYHEKIAVSDLEAISCAITSIKELAVTKAFWECQYYKINETKGISILGYILFLEAISTTCFEKAYLQVENKFGKRACNFIRVHVNEDPDHVNHALELIEGLSKSEQNLIWDNFYQTADMYHALLNSVSLPANQSALAHVA